MTSSSNNAFIQYYKKIVKCVYIDTLREDFELLRDADPMTLVIFIEKNKEHLNEIDQEISYRLKSFEPIDGASLCNAWSKISKNNQEVILAQMTLIKKCIVKDQPDEFAHLDTKTIDEKKDDKKEEARSELKKKLKTKIKGGKGKFKKVAGNSNIDIDYIKKAFGGLAGEGIVKDLIDSLAGGIKNMDTSKDADVGVSKNTESKPKSEIESKLDELTSQLPEGVTIDPKLKSLASLATEKFAPQLDAAGADGEQLLSKANHILKKLKKMQKKKH